MTNFICLSILFSPDICNLFAPVVDTNQYAYNTLAESRCSEKNIPGLYLNASLHANNQVFCLTRIQALQTAMLSSRVSDSQHSKGRYCSHFQVQKPWRWRRHVPSKHWRPISLLLSVINPKDLNLYTKTFKTKNLTHYDSCFHDFPGSYKNNEIRYNLVIITSFQGLLFPHSWWTDDSHLYTDTHWQHL